MISDPECIRNNGQGRIHGAAGYEEAGVHHIEIVHIVRSAVHVEDRGLGIASEPDGAALVRGGAAVESRDTGFEIRDSPVVDDGVDGTEMALASVGRAAATTFGPFTDSVDRSGRVL